MKCKCWKEVDDKLREKNLRLTGATFVMPNFALVPTITTAWVDKEKAPKGQKRNPPAMLASHCPFCGVKIETKLTDEEEQP
jgi:hypothetical protein